MYAPDAMDDARYDRAWDAAHTATSEKVDLESMLPIDDPIDEQFPVLSNASSMCFSTRGKNNNAGKIMLEIQSFLLGNLPGHKLFSRVGRVCLGWDFRVEF